MDTWTTARLIFPDGRAAEANFPVWLLPLPGDLVTIPGEVGADRLLVPLRVTARLLQPEPIDSEARVTLFVDSAVEEAGRSALKIMR